MARSQSVIRLIGIFKLAKAAILVAGGVGLIGLHWAQGLGLDPQHGYLGLLLGKLDRYTIGEQEALGVAALVYAALFAIEGVGLLRERRWAEYLTSIITGSFIPLELYEIVEHGSPLKVATLVVNVAIVGYLVLRIRRRHRDRGQAGERELALT